MSFCASDMCMCMYVCVSICVHACACGVCVCVAGAIVKHPALTPSVVYGCYWAIQAGLLTPLTFVRHRSSPLAAFTPGVYFLHNGRW